MFGTLLITFDDPMDFAGGNAGAAVGKGTGGPQFFRVLCVLLLHDPLILWGPMQARLAAQGLVVGNLFWVIGGWDPGFKGDGGDILADVWTLDLDSLLWEQRTLSVGAPPPPLSLLRLVVTPLYRSSPSHRHFRHFVCYKGLTTNCTRGVMKFRVVLKVVFIFPVRAQACVCVRILFVCGWLFIFLFVCGCLCMFAGG